MKLLAAFILSLSLSLSPQAELTLPAWSGYSRADAGSVRRNREEHVTAFARELAFYVHLQQPGAVALEVALAEGATAEQARLRASFGHQHGREEVEVELRAQGAQVLSGGPVWVAEPGYHRIVLHRTDRPEGPLPAAIVGLTLRGESLVGAHATTVERRNAASVHLGYPRPTADTGRERDDIEWFHCRVTPRHDPLWSYYMATGWHRGYFGMQVNSPTERRVIFSVWDSGDEAIDRAKVAPEDLVQLVAKGTGVHASGFGNEGTGGHSHLVFPWQLGDTLEFLVQAAPAGSATTYTGWFRVSREGEPWRLVASFRAPKDGKHLRGLYSFNENFWGANGDVRRVCEFHGQWVRTSAGTWHELLDARFTCDGHGVPNQEAGQPGRLDRSAGARGDRFYLAHGGFVDDPTPGAVTQYGAALRRASSGSPPPLTAEELAALPRE